MVRLPVLLKGAYPTNLANPGTCISDRSRPCRRKIIPILCRTSKYRVHFTAVIETIHAHETNTEPGIHGKPTIEWNGAGDRLAGEKDWDGYCPHGVRASTSMLPSELQLTRETGKDILALASSLYTALRGM